MAIKNCSVRFNLDYPKHRQAWELLNSMDRERYKSYSNVVITALIEYFDRQQKVDADPFFVTKEREDEFAARILEAVKNGLDNAMYDRIMSILLPNSAEVRKQVSELDEPDEVDWGFVGDKVTLREK